VLLHRLYSSERVGIIHFLTTRLAYININSAISNPIFLHCGVPQGSSLSPLLYLLFVADFPHLPPNIHLFQYADDTAFLALSHSMQHINRTLTEAINTFTTWCSKWGLTINSRKTQAIVFIPPRHRSRVRGNPNRLNIQVSHEPVIPSKQVTYLGIIFDHHLTWRPHLQKIISNATNRLNLQKRLLGTTWGLKPTTIINTYKAFLRPVLTYGFPAWISTDVKFYKKLQILERHALRIAYRVKLPSPTHELYERITFPHLLLHLEKLRTKYITRRYEENHLLLHDIIQNHETHPIRTTYVQPPLSLLFTLYHYTLPPNHPDFAYLSAFHLPDMPHHVAPSNVAQ